MNEKLCVFCEQFELDMGYPDLSEVTLGSPASVCCLKGYWVMRQGTHEIEFRSIISKASTCRDYQRAVHDPKP